MYDASPEVIAALDKGFMQYTHDEAIAILKSCGTIAVSKVQHTKDVKDDPQVLENEMVFPFIDADGRKVMMPSTPVKIGDNTAAKYGQGEELGASTKEILRSLGYTEDVIEDWCDKGIVYAKED